jgi:hypothetical protein
MGRQIRGDCSEDVVFVTTWRDLASLYNWIGGDNLLASPMFDGDEALFAHLEVQHYEAMDDAPAEGAADFVATVNAAGR